jgi:hypothetical protein
MSDLFTCWMNDTGESRIPFPQEEVFRWAVGKKNHVSSGNAIIPLSLFIPQKPQ